MNLYSSLSAIGFLKKSYVLKFLFVAFLGIHVPLLGVIAFVVFFENMLSPMVIFMVVLTLTLVATALTLLVLRKLVSPIEKTSKALELYCSNRIIPKLPLDYTDEAGLLMNTISHTVRNIEALLNDKQDTAYLLSHDLKNMAQAPASLAKLIAEENVSDKVRDYTRLIIASSERQTDFLNTFISVLKEEEELSKMKMKVSTIDFTAIADAVKLAVEAQCRAKEISLNIQVKTVSGMIRADKSLLVQVVVNLVENSIKFSYPRSEISLTIERVRASLQIRVEDNGIGFDDSKSADLFRKFTTMGRLGTANEKSTGIGLYLCRQILKKSDGTITASSPGTNQGAVFRIDLKMYRKK